MIYHLPLPDEPIDQGDLIDSCPVIRVTSFHPDQPRTATVEMDTHRGIVLTQTCDLANKKVEEPVLASAFEAQYLVDQKIPKSGDIQGPLRAGRIWGWYFLPADVSLGLGEMVIDLRRLYTVRLELLANLCRAGKRRARLKSPYREHDHSVNGEQLLPRFGRQHGIG